MSDETGGIFDFPGVSMPRAAGTVMRTFSATVSGANVLTAGKDL